MLLTLDSAADLCLLANPDVITNLRESNIRIMQANGDTAEVGYEGEIMLRTPTGDVCIMRALYDKMAPGNLLSVAALVEAGYEVHLGVGLNYIKPPGAGYTEVDFDGKNFTVVATTTSDGALVMENNSELSAAVQMRSMTNLSSAERSRVLKWQQVHRSLAHMSQPDMRRAAREGTIQGLEIHDVPRIATPCVACELVKKRIKPRWRRREHTQVAGRTWHSDFCGPFSSGQNQLWIIILIGEATRYSLSKIYMTTGGAPRGDDVLELVQHAEEYMKLLRSRKSNDDNEYHIKNLHADSHRVYKSNVLKEFLAQRGGVVTTSEKARPWQNSIAERSFGTLQRKTMTVLTDNSLGFDWAPLAFQNVQAIMNFTPHGKTNRVPYEHFTKSKAPKIDDIPEFLALVRYQSEALTDLQLKMKKKSPLHDGVDKLARFVRIMPVTADRPMQCQLLLPDRHKRYRPDGAKVLVNLNVVERLESQPPMRRLPPDHDIPTIEGGWRDIQMRREAERIGVDDVEYATNLMRAISLDGAEGDQGEDMADAPMTIDEARAYLEDRNIEYGTLPHSKILGLGLEREGEKEEAHVDSVIDDEFVRGIRKIANNPDYAEAMAEEVQKLKDFGVFAVEPTRLDGTKTVLSLGATAKVKPSGKRKARVHVVGRFQPAHSYGVNLFAPTARHVSLRTLIAIATTLGEKVHAFDTTSAYLHTDLLEEIYIRPCPGVLDLPEGVEDDGKWGFRLLKCLYGLK